MICMVHASGKCGDGSPPRATGSRSQVPHRADQDTGGRGTVSGTGGIGSCQGSGRSRSGNENNLTIPILLSLPVNFFKAEHPAVVLRGISVWLCFVSCDTSFFSYDHLHLARSFILSPRFFSLQSHFSCEAPESIQGMDMGLGWLRFFAGRKGERMMVLGEYHDQLSANSETGDVSRFKGE